MRRRSFLATIGLSATASTAGCIDSALDGGERGIQLARFSVGNLDSDPHRFDLRVERDGETVHRSTHRVRGTSEDIIHGAVADCDWGTTPGTYEVFVRVDGGEWTAKPLSEVRDGWRDSVECATAHAEYYENGNLWIRLRDDCERFVPSAATGVCSPDDQTAE